ncbi:hypothetical protein NE237_032101 [Protea cynaroides]|uniref:Uncharacterized protein n=1 Tax=Protea cynaroides TaxID=273540 RepID=A0A9Q0L3L6_9MAGN|nr:hypothetical protein NE237_032101 [Protea cynaroides]
MLRCRGYSAVRFTWAMPMCRGVDECSTSRLLGNAKVLRIAKVARCGGVLCSEVYSACQVAMVPSYRGAECSAVRFTRSYHCAQVLSRRGMLRGQVYLVLPMFREMLNIQVYSVILKCRGVEEFSAVRCTRSCRFAVGSMSAPLSGLLGHAEVPSSVPWLGLINHAEMSSALWLGLFG